MPAKAIMLAQTMTIEKAKDGAINAMIPVQQKQLCQKQQEYPQQ